VRTFWLLSLPMLGCSPAVGDNHINTSPTTHRHALIGNTIGLDHVLLWAGDQPKAQATLERLGFTLSPKAGSYGAGISNKLIRFENRSFIEFLWLSDPVKAEREAPDEYRFVRSYNGSNAFGVQVEDADDTYKALTAAGLKPDDPGGEAWDPDGPTGPQKPMVAQWRFMFLKGDDFPGNPFFVEYNLADGARSAPPIHGNGARKLSSVWIVTSDAQAAEAAYDRAAFTRRALVTLPRLRAKGVALGAGAGDVLLLQPTGGGVLKQRLAKRGPHVVGMSVQVADLGVAQRLLEDRFGVKLNRFRGRFGQSLIAPTTDALGLLIELHE
jgi:hypothetical protein